MSFSITDNVRVVKQRCCFGFPRGTELTIIKQVEEKGSLFYICLPVAPEFKTGSTRNGLWHCPSCLEKITPEVKKDGTNVN